MMAEANVGSQVTIPSSFTTRETFVKLRIDLTAGGVNVTLKHKACPTSVSYLSNVVWGDTPGHGDFSTGLGAWTTEKLSSIINKPGTYQASSKAIFIISM
jgi:hypothetical protein